MEENTVLRFVYTFFVGMLLALFVGFGVSTFYPAPDAPTYPIELSNAKTQLTLEQETLQRTYEQEMQQYTKDIEPYNRNVSIITLVAAVVFIVVSIAFESRIKILANGVMFGGLFTLIYSIGRGVASGDSKYVFGVLAVSLVVILLVGYRRFVQVRRIGEPVTHRAY